MKAQLSRRLDINPRRAILIRVLGGVAALVLTGLILSAAGRNPFTLADKSIRSTFTTQIGFEDTLLIATPILMAAVAVAIGFRARVWNIGVAGQFYMGAWGAALIGLHYDGPAVISIPLMH